MKNKKYKDRFIRLCVMFMKYVFFLTFFLFLNCNQNKNGNTVNNFELKPLSPFKHEFITGNQHNRADCYYLGGNFHFEEDYYQELKKKIDKIYVSIGYKHFYSVYIYKKTENINHLSQHNKSWLDGENKNLLAFIRFNTGVNDIFYILKDGTVLYDMIEKKETNFEFDE